MRQRSTSCELKMTQLKEEDSGEYFCVCGTQTTSATLRVEGMDVCQNITVMIINFL